MKPWRKIVTLHTDIKRGKIDESVFAADLGDVVSERGPVEYQDPELFFKKTFPTKGLLNLLVAILKRLSGKGEGEAVIQIQTPFGGGKTHSLIALYHLFKSGNAVSDLESVKKVLEEAGVDKIPDTKIVTFVGTTKDVFGGKTPWGELAYQLGRLDLIRTHEEKRVAPGKDLLHKIIGDEPTLILMDEIAEYAVRAKDFRAQVMAFFQEITETVKVLPRASLVVTLPSSFPYGEEGEEVLSQLQRIFGRVETIYTPVEGEEIYEVIRRRLFEDIGDIKERKRTVSSYWELYQKLGEDVPPEVRQPAYKERMLKSYPFHPELIDVLFERWSSYSTFQRTRGVLRLLSNVVSDLYMREDNFPLIQSSHVNLANSKIRREFIKHIGNEYEAVIASDIANGNAKAKLLNQEIGTEYVKYSVATGLATSIFLYSFSGGEKQGISLPQLRVCFLREDIPPALIGDSLKRLEETLWYLHEKRGLYHFKSQPNLNKIIREWEGRISKEMIKSEIQEFIKNLAGREFKVYSFPQAPDDIPDSRELKLAILSFDFPASKENTKIFVSDLLERSGGTFRVYKNTLFLIAPHIEEESSLNSLVRRYLAIRAIKGDRSLYQSLSDEDKRIVESKLKELERNIPDKLFNVYRTLYKSSREGYEVFNLGIPTVGEKTTISKRVKNFLMTQDLLFDKISPRNLINKVFAPEEKQKTVEEIIEAFLKFPDLPVPVKTDVIKEAIKKGVGEGEFALKINDKVYYRTYLPLEDIELDATVIRDYSPPPPAFEIKAEEIMKFFKPNKESLSVRIIYETLHYEKKDQFRDPADFDRAFLNALKLGIEKGMWQLVPSVPIDPVNLDKILNVSLKKTGVVPPPPPPPPPVKKTYILKAQIPWDRLSDFVRGVIIPLHNDGAELVIKIEIKADHPDKVNESTIERKVRETLKQINAEIEEEKII